MSNMSYFKMWNVIVRASRKIEKGRWSLQSCGIIYSSTESTVSIFVNLAFNLNRAMRKTNLFVCGTVELLYVI